MPPIPARNQASSPSRRTNDPVLPALPAQGRFLVQAAEDGRRKIALRLPASRPGEPSHHDDERLKRPDRLQFAPPIPASKSPALNHADGVDAYQPGASSGAGPDRHLGYARIQDLLPFRSGRGGRQGVAPNSPPLIFCRQPAINRNPHLRMLSNNNNQALHRTRNLLLPRPLSGQVVLNSGAA